MTVLRKMFIFKMKHRIGIYWSPKVNRFFSCHISVGEEVAEDFGKNYDKKTNASNSNLELQNTLLQYAHDHSKRKFTKGFGRGPGLKDFIIASQVQPVKCETVPYVRNATINGLNRKGNPNYPPFAISIYSLHYNIQSTEHTKKLLPPQTKMHQLGR
jgi:hypothetical protein